VTEQADRIDWDEIERRERRTNWPAYLALVAVFVAIVLLSGRFAFWEGRAAWIALAVFLAIPLLLQLVAVLRPPTGPRARMLRFRYALIHRADPGPGVREKVDVAARQLAGMRWVLWLFPFAPLGMLLGARWDRPLTTVPAALVLVGGAALFVVYWLRMTTAARRWVADPPGPEREVPPPTRRERLTSGPAVKWTILGLVVVGVLIGLVSALVFGD
jgi:hypothetical protein